MKRDSGRWGEKVDSRNVLEPQGVGFQQMSASLEGRWGKKKTSEERRKKKKKKTNTNTPAF